MSHDFYKDSMIFGIWTKFSRILGLIRDNICGRLFGTSIEFGAFALAFRLPDLFRRLLDEGALSAVFIPQIVDEIEAGDKKKSSQFASTLFSILMITLALICVSSIIVFFGISQLVALNEKGQYILRYSLILIPYLIFIALIALLSSILNVLGQFFVTAISPVIFNIVWIISLIIAWKCFQSNNERLTLVCFFLTFSGVLQVGLLLYTLRKQDWKIQFSFNQESFPYSALFRKFLPVTFCLAVFQINLLVDGVIGFFLVDSKHTLAALYYSDRIQQLPLGIIAISIATASFPMLSIFHSQNKKEEFRSTLTKALRGVWFLTIPSLIGIVFLCTPLVQQFYSFKDPESTIVTANTLAYFAIGLVFTCTTPLLTRAFYAIGNIKIPTIAGLISVFLNLILGVILVSSTNLGGAAIALATSISSTFNASVLFYFAYKKFKLIDLTQIKSNALKLFIPSLVLILWLLAMLNGECHKIIDTVSNEIFWFSNHPNLFYLCFAILGGILIFMVTALLIKCTEFNEMFLKNTPSLDK